MKRVFFLTLLLALFTGIGVVHADSVNSSLTTNEDGLEVIERIPPPVEPGLPIIVEEFEISSNCYLRPPLGGSIVRGSCDNQQPGPPRPPIE